LVFHLPQEQFRTSSSLHKVLVQEQQQHQWKQQQRLLFPDKRISSTRPSDIPLLCAVGGVVIHL
jgi:hypothetical protein